MTSLVLIIIIFLLHFQKNTVEMICCLAVGHGFSCTTLFISVLIFQVLLLFFALFFYNSEVKCINVKLKEWGWKEGVVKRMHLMANIYACN